jgi:hypothetical protein
MTYSSGFHMPGAFHTEGIHQGLFRPPVSPASSSGYLPQTRHSGDGPTPKRKRVRDETNRQLDQGQPQDSPQVNHNDVNANGSTVLITPAGRHAHNGRVYTLAGQLDTLASGSAESGLLGDSMYSDSDYRKALGSKRSRDDGSMTDPMGHVPLFNFAAQPQPSPGWGTLAFSTLGGVVGKVWEFCKAGAFKGFYAGGGRGFEMQPGDGIMPDGSVPDQTWPREEQEEDENHRRIPGYFPQGDTFYDQGGPEDGFIPSGASTPSAPAAKRRQTAPTDELGRNWVMVKDRGNSIHTTPRRTSAAERQSPRNRNQGPSLATGRRISTPNNRRAASKITSPSPYRATPRNGFNISPPATLDPPRPASSASFASTRSPSPTKLASVAPVVGVAASPTHPSRGHGRRRSLIPTPSHPSSS